MTEIQHTPLQLVDIYRYNHKVPLYLWIVLLIVLGSASALNAWVVLHGYRRRKLAGHCARTRFEAVKGCSRTGKACTRWAPAAVVSVFRKYSIRESRMARALGMMNIGQLALLVIYLGVNLGLCLGGPYAEISWQAHHAARLSYANLPLVIGLASKNNLISYVTGVPYESLNVFHRWSARLVLLLVTIHIAGRAYVQDPPTTPNGHGQAYIRYGIAAYIAMAWLVILSFRPIRNAKYSFFLITHVLAVLVLLATLWVHRPQMKGWIIAGLVVYFFDRAWRSARVAYYLTFGKLHLRKGQPTAWVEALSTDTIRVSVLTRMDWVPGAHVYLHCPTTSLTGHLGHPFTISNISRPLTQVSGKKSGLSTQELIVRVRKGVTKDLFEKTLALPSPHLAGSNQSASRWPTASIQAWPEGAYGRTQYMADEFQSLLLVCGGSGVTFGLSLMLDIVRRAGAMYDPAGTASPVACTRLSFVWIIRNMSQLEWIAKHLLEAQAVAPIEFLHQAFLHITIYCTQKTTVNPLIGLHPDSQRLCSMDRVSVRQGRPNFTEMLETEIDHTHFTDWLAVGTCGPSNMCSDLAAAVSLAIRPKSVLRGEHRRNIYFSHEEYGW